MRVAALYDIHGNLPALEAVLNEVHRAGVDVIVIGGDVLPGPMPREVLARLSGVEVPIRFVMGNGDREVVSYRNGQESDAVPEPFRESMRWNASQLSDHDAAAIAGWPATITLTLAAVGDVMFCHATPHNDIDIFTQRTADEVLMPVFADVSAPLVVCGHTHMQFDRTVGRTRIVNAGSVGMPFGEPGAYWLLIDGAIHLQRTAYDLEAAAARIRATGYPQAEQFASASVLAPPPEQQILEAFTQAELTRPGAPSQRI
ncbi:MAG TPA: metallophosphoesterase family protein [Vicinamibacterales bacterium]|nr:metallophosphoesterase family protein [Vicinamibacterales bacterium]